jgi:3-hydroxybutyryl-CoA dehydratase
MSFTAYHLYFDDIEAGQEFESLGRTITEADIVNFAGVSGDFNPIHMDHDFAKTTLFRRPIAHGLLIFSIGSGLTINSPPMRTLAFLSIQEWHFRGPIYIGDTIKVKTKVLAKEPRGRGRRGIITWQRQIFNQEAKLTQEGVTLTMVEGRGGTRTNGEAAGEA